jgi:hypothetical protein
MCRSVLEPATSSATVRRLAVVAVLITSTATLHAQEEEGGSLLGGLRRLDRFLSNPVEVRQGWVQERWDATVGALLGPGAENASAVGRSLTNYHRTSYELIGEAYSSESPEKADEAWRWMTVEGRGQLESAGWEAFKRGLPAPLRRPVEGIEETVEDAKWVQEKVETGIAWTKSKFGEYLDDGADFGLEPGSSEATLAKTGLGQDPESASRGLKSFVGDLPPQEGDLISYPAEDERGLVAGVLEAYPALALGFSLDGLAASGSQGARDYEDAGDAGAETNREPYAASFPAAEYPERVGITTVRLCPDGNIVEYTIPGDQEVWSPESTAARVRLACESASADSPDEALAAALLQRATSSCPECAPESPVADGRQADDAASALRRFGGTAMAGAAADKAAQEARSSAYMSSLSPQYGLSAPSASGALGSGATARGAAADVEALCPGWTTRKNSLEAQFRPLFERIERNDMSLGICDISRGALQYQQQLRNLLNMCPRGPEVEAEKRVVDAQIRQYQGSAAASCR